MGHLKWQGRGPDGGDSKFQIDVVVVRIVVVRIKYNPAPRARGFSLAGAPSKLSIRPGVDPTAAAAVQ